jgi:hypothetical protein
LWVKKWKNAVFGRAARDGQVPNSMGLHVTQLEKLLGPQS